MDESSVHPLENRKETRGYRRNIPVFVIVTIFFIAISFILLFALSFDRMSLTVIFVLVLAFYLSITSFLLEPRIVKEILRTITKIEEKPIIREIEKKIFIDRPIIREIEKRIFVDRPIIREIEKKIFIDRPVYVYPSRKRLTIPRYGYLGSSQTKTYHSRNCRFGKLIKRKYKVSNNSISFFKNRGYSACKVCLKK